MCKACKRDYNKIWYVKNSERQELLAMANSERYKLQIRAIVRQAKDRPCADCGHRYPYYVMDFDHIGSNDKLDNIAAMAGRRHSVAGVLAEIAKCEVVCANCHSIRTFARLGNARPS